MKKLFSFALALTMVLSCCVFFTSAHKDNDRIGYVPSTTAAITIDGAKDDAYANSLKVAVDAPLGSDFNLTTDDFAKGQAYLLVSSDYTKLYVYAIISDNHLVLSPASDLSEEAPEYNAPYTHDGFEIFLDPSNTYSAKVDVDDYNYPHISNQENGHLYQFRMELNKTKSSYTPGAKGQDTLNGSFEASRSILKDGSGYTVEFSINLTDLKNLTGADCAKKNADIGIQLMINDKVDEALTGNNTLNGIDGVPTLGIYGGANSPSVWSSSDWMYITLGDSETKGAGNDIYKDVQVSNSDVVANAGNTASATGDTVAIGAVVLVMAAGGAVVFTKKRRSK